MLSEESGIEAKPVLMVFRHVDDVTLGTRLLARQRCIEWAAEDLDFRLWLISMLSIHSSSVHMSYRHK